MKSIRKAVLDYYQRESKWNLLSNFVFVVFLILMLIPATRQEILPRIQRLVLMSPSVEEPGEQKQLLAADYLFQYTDAQGQLHSLEEHKGKVLFLNVWATWCSPCIAEMPSIEELHKDYASRVDFLFLTDEKPEHVAAFLRKRGHELPFQLLNYRLPETLATNSLPTTFVISKTGKVVIHRVGTAKWNSSAVREQLDKLLAE